MVTIGLDENSVENFRAIRELQSFGFPDEDIQRLYDKQVEVDRLAEEGGQG